MRKKISRSVKRPVKSVVRLVVKKKSQLPPIQAPKPLSLDVIDMCKRWAAPKNRKCDVCNTVLNSYNRTGRCALHRKDDFLRQGEHNEFQKEKMQA